MRSVLVFMTILATQSNPAWAVDGVSKGHCRVSSLIQEQLQSRSFPTVAFGDRLDFPLQTAEVRIKAARFSTKPFLTVNAIFGKVELTQKIRMLDKDRKLIEQPISVSLDIQRPVATADGQATQKFRFVARVFNVFTGQPEEIKMETTQWVNSPIPYLEHGMNPQDRSLLKNGDLVGQILFCEFSPRDTMLGDHPSRPRLTDFAKP